MHKKKKKRHGYAINATMATSKGYITQGQEPQCMQFRIPPFCIQLYELQHNIDHYTGSYMRLSQCCWIPLSLLVQKSHLVRTRVEMESCLYPLFIFTKFSNLYCVCSILLFYFNWLCNIRLIGYKLKLHDLRDSHRGS